MNYLEPETLKFFLYFIYRHGRFGISLDQFNPNLVDKILQDIIDNSLEDIFDFSIFINMPAQSEKIDDIDCLIYQFKKHIEPHYKDFDNINNTLNAIINHDMDTSINLNELKILRKRGFWSPSIYHFLSLNLLKSKDNKLLKFLKKYISLFENEEVWFKRFGIIQNYYKKDGKEMSGFDRDESAHELLLLQNYTSLSSYYGIPEVISAIV